MKRPKIVLMILSLLACFGIFIFFRSKVVNSGTGVANRIQNVEKLGDEEIIKKDSLKWEVLQGTLDDAVIKALAMEKWEKWEEILNELNLTDRIKESVNCAPDTMPEGMTVSKYVLLELTMDDKIQKDLKEYNEKRKTQINYEAVLGACSILSQILEREKTVAKNVK
ncbi:MAG: hypothetical protein ABIH48_01850 [Candidatus Falkowbacteria bacterium]